MSGDASNGVSEFNANGSAITTNKGDTFYITNTSSKITLSNNKFINADSTGNFLRAQKDSWVNLDNADKYIFYLQKRTIIVECIYYVWKYEGRINHG